jgi:hypothetical protein
LARPHARSRQKGKRTCGAVGNRDCHSGDDADADGGEGLVISKGSNTTTTTQSPTALPAYQQAIGQLQSVAQNPYNPYTGELVSPVNQQQQAGIGNINNYATAGVPYLQTAAGLQEGAANPLTQQQIQQYQSPYTQDVVNATEAQFNNQNAIQQQQVLGNAAAQGALGGDRTAVAQAVLAGQQQTQEAPVIAGLENQGYTQALQTAGQQFQQNPEQAAYGIASTGQGLENAALTGANAQVGAGTLEQQTQQAQDTAAYQQFMQQQFMPESMLSWELPLLTGVGSQEGGTSTTTGPAPNPLAQYLGLGIAGVGAAGQAGGSAGIAGLAALSDKRAKENIRKIGHLNDGQPIYRFNYKGDPQTRVGMIAQEVEKVNPDAVHEINGLKHVDYDEATKDAVRRYFGGRVQGLQTGGIPGGFSPGALPGNPWLSSAQMPHGPGAPPPPKVPGQPVQTPQQMVQNATGLATAMKKAVGDTSNNNPAFGGGNALTDSFGGSSSAPLEGLDASDYGVGYRRGGRTAPVRAGLGMASFMPRRRFADGGSPDDDGDVVNFPADRWAKPSVPAGLYNNAAGDANPLENILKFQTYGLNSPYAPAASAEETPRTAAADELPPQITQGTSSPSAAPQAGIGTSAMAFAPQDTGSREAPLPAAPDSVNAPPASISAMLERADSGKGLFGLSPDFYQSLMAAGLGMMASRSPFLGTAIGEGGMQGLQTYGGLKKQEQDVDLKVRQLDQAAKAEQDRIANEAKRTQLAESAQQFAQTQMTPAQKAEAEFRERNLQREMMQPVKIGTDMATGTDIYAVRDPNAPSGFRRIDAATFAAPLGPTPTPQGTGAPATAPAPLPPTSSAPGAAPNPNDESRLPATSTPVSGDTPDNVKPEVLASLDPNLASQVKALDEGRMAFPTGFALKSPYWQNILRLVSQYDPSFDAVNYNARAKTRADFVAGKSAQNITSFNTAIGHLDTLDKSIDALGNTNYGWINPMLQSAKSAMGDTGFQAAQKQFMAAKQAVTDELTRAFRGSGGNVHDIVGWEQTLNQADSPAALHAATKAAVDLLRSRIESVGDQYNRGMGTTRDPLTMLSPHAQAAVARLSGEAAPVAAVDPRDAAALKANSHNPAAAAAIDNKYGKGTAAQILGTQ